MHLTGVQCEGVVCLHWELTGGTVEGGRHLNSYSQKYSDNEHFSQPQSALVGG